MPRDDGYIYFTTEHDPHAPYVIFDWVLRLTEIGPAEKILLAIIMDFEAHTDRLEEDQVFTLTIPGVAERLGTTEESIRASLDRLLEVGLLRTSTPRERCCIEGVRHYGKAA